MSLSEQAIESVIAVETQPERAEVLSSYLALYGIRLTVFGSIFDAVSATAKIPPAVVVANLDCISPGQSVAELFGKSSGHRTLLIALGDEADSEVAGGAGFDLFLPKPTDFETLAEIIRNYDGG